ETAELVCERRRLTMVSPALDLLFGALARRGVGAQVLPAVSSRLARALSVPKPGSNQSRVPVPRTRGGEQSHAQRRRCHSRCRGPSSLRRSAWHRGSPGASFQTADTSLALPIG